MEEEKQLKDRIYYSDLYDRHTVDQCRNLIRLHSQPMKDPPLIGGQVPSKELMDATLKMTTDMGLLFTTGDRYIKKEETINQWMDRDCARDEFYTSARVPQGVRCLKCRSVMNVLDKTLWTNLNKPDRVLFMFDCPNGCLPRRAFYNNGEEWLLKPDPCPKCRAPLKSADKTTEAKFVTEYKCSSCDFTKTDEIERTANKEEKPDPDFAADRTRFCLSEEEGQRWRQSLANLDGMKRLVDQWKEEEKHKDEYDKIAKLKKLTIIELEKLLVPVCEKEGYVKFQFGTPDMERDVFLPFTAYDSKPDRIDKESSYKLQQIITATLADTNWRLLTEGIHYRLGILSGRLRAYEKEEDLLKLVSQKDQKV